MNYVRWFPLKYRSKEGIKIIPVDKLDGWLVEDDSNFFTLKFKGHPFVDRSIHEITIEYPTRKELEDDYNDLIEWWGK